jgi:hypothetical protein
MRFQVKKRNARKLREIGRVRDDVIDLDSGNTVGYVETEQGGWIGDTRLPTRRISLFDGKYRGSFDNHEECAAFAEGVEAVLNHMVSLGEKQSSEAAQPITPSAIA